MQLTNGSRVVVVGGGPAGSFSAMQLLRLSKEARLDLEVVIFEARNFNQPGPGGCNKCAGILSSSCLENMETLGLRLPVDVIQAELDTYILNLGGLQLPIHPMDPSRRILSVYRGSGPRWGSDPLPQSFDGWLLDQARERGAFVRRSRVQTIKPGTRPIVITPRESLEADLVVVSTGINNSSPLDSAWGYRPPQIEVMAQDEVPLLSTTSGSQVHVFLDHPAGLIFGGVIPKGRYANISLLGKKLPQDSFSQFMNHRGLIPLLPETPSVLCSCTPRVSVTSGSGYYDDRMVVVGDAAVTRLYKDGIGAAFTTARAAIQTAIFRGISQSDFRKGYDPICRRIARDNFYGHLLFRSWALFRRSPLFINAWGQAILSEALLPTQQRVLERVLWGVFTGEETYRQILSLMLSWPAIRSFLGGILKTWSKR